MAQRLKRLPAMRETWVRSLGQEDPLEKEMATHSSTLAWKIPWTEEPGGLQSMGYNELDTTEQLHKPQESPRRSNQSILKEINPEYPLEGLLQKVKYQYFGCLM